MPGSTKLETREEGAIQGSLDDASAAQAERDEDDGEPNFLDPKRIIQTLVIVLVLVAGIYILLPKLVGLEDAIAKVDDGDPFWIAVAFVFTVLISASYIALFRGIVGENVLALIWGEAYEISMASFAASRLFSGGGAGGIVVTYWALRKAGMERRQAATRMVAFLVMLYSIYLVSLVVFGILLRTGVLAGASPPGLTIVPAAVAGVLIVVLGLMALIPADVERRMERWSAGYRFGRIARRLATVPDTLARGTRTALAFIREPKRGGLALAGSIGFWAANIARCGRASRPSTSTSRSASSSRATSSAWSPT